MLPSLPSTHVCLLWQCNVHQAHTSAKVSACTCLMLQGAHRLIVYGSSAVLHAVYTTDSDHSVLSTMPNACFGCSYDGTVRNSVGDVIQFLYGEDGMDGAAIEGQTMEHLRWDRKKLEVCSSCSYKRDFLHCIVVVGGA